MRWTRLIVGALAVLIGAVWTLQGLNLLGGSPMTGNKMWAVIGPIVVVAGAVLFGTALKKRPPAA